MAKNKYALIRYKALDRCFRNPGMPYTIDDLLTACNNALHEEDPKSSGIQKRQLYDDIRFMETEAGYSIDLVKTRKGKEVYYRYADINFSIAEQSLSEAEAAQIKEAVLILSRFKGMPQFEWIDEITARLESSFGLKKGAELIIDFEQNKYLKGLEFISDLFNAILYKRVLKISYQSFKQSNEFLINFHPYYLKQYNCRWFCFGYNEEQSKITNLALDRIKSITDLKGLYKENNFDFSDYFEDVVGVTVEGDLHNVVLKVQKDLWPYIETKPIHGSQKVKQRDKDHVTVGYNLRLNYELESLLLSHGEKIEILEPEHLKARLSGRLKAIKY